MTTTPITGETWGDEIEKPRAHILQEAQKPFSSLKADFENAYAGLLAQLQDVSDAYTHLKSAPAFA